jgi:hypothetical protein
MHFTTFLIGLVIGVFISAFNIGRQIDWLEPDEITPKAEHAKLQKIMVENNLATWEVQDDGTMLFQLKGE